MTAPRPAVLGRNQLIAMRARVRGFILAERQGDARLAASKAVQERKAQAGAMWRPVERMKT